MGLSKRKVPSGISIVPPSGGRSAIIAFYKISTISGPIGWKSELGYVYNLLTVTFITESIGIVIAARCAQHQEHSAY